MPEADIDTTADTSSGAPPAHVEERPAANEEPEGKGGKAAVLADLAKERDARQTADNARKAAEAKIAEAEKTISELATKVKGFEDRNKSESEKLQEAIDAAKTAASDAASERDAARKELLRYRIGMATEGFPASLIPRLQGDTEEEIADDAMRLMEQLAPAIPKRKPPTTAPGLKSGASAPGDHGGDKKQRAAQALRNLQRGS